MHKPLSLAALIAAVAVAACDRGGADPEKEPSAYTRNGPQATAPAATSNAPAVTSSTPAATEAAPARQTLAPATPERDTLSDTVITGKIKAAILTDPGMTGADVTVNTDKGVVVLAGSVKSQEQTAIASAHAQRQDGVLRVDNQLAMAPQ